MPRARILIVTPEPGVSLAPDLPDILREAGYHVEVVAHGPDALLSLATARPHLVVTEARDLRREGVAFAHIVRDRPAFAELPLLALVGDIGLRDHAALLVAGFDRVTPAATAALSVMHSAEALLCKHERVPSLREAFARMASITFVPQHSTAAV